MAAKIIILACFAATVTAIAIPVAPVKTIYAEPEAPAHYEFAYSVEDQHTGDMKEQHESRAGDAVHGSYSLLQPDGMRRIVEYTSDKEHGFNAIVRYEGHAAPAVAYAPAPVAKIAYAPAPVAKIAYAPAPVAKYAYAPAPVAKYAYAPAPVAKYAYAAAPVAKVAYAPAVAKVAYAPAPVAKVAYPAKVFAAPAPFAKVAYAQPLGHVTYSSPAVSYHH